MLSILLEIDEIAGRPDHGDAMRPAVLRGDWRRRRPSWPVSRLTVRHRPAVPARSPRVGARVGRQLRRQATQHQRGADGAGDSVKRRIELPPQLLAGDAGSRPWPLWRRTIEAVIIRRSESRHTHARPRPRKRGIFRTAGVGAQGNCRHSNQKYHHQGGTHDRSDPPQRPVGAAAACAATALRRASSPAIGRGAAASKQAPGWYRYKVGSNEVTAVTDGAQHLPAARHLRRQRQEGRGRTRRCVAAHMEKDMMTVPYTPIVINTGGKLVVIDTGTGEAQLRAQQGRGRPVPRQSEGRRHRPQRGRHGDHLALPRRPHQRPAQRRTASRRSPTPRSWCRRWRGSTSRMTAR